MEITELVLAVIGAISIPAGWIMYRRKRRAHGAMEVREALIQLDAATDDGELVFVRNHGLLGEDGRVAMRNLKKAEAAVVDKELAELVRHIEQLYVQAEAAAVPPGQTSAWEYAARAFDEHQPAKEFKARIAQAVARASKLDRRGAGS